NAAAGGPLLAAGKVLGGPQQFAARAAMLDLEAVAVESQLRKDSGLRARRLVLKYDGLVCHGHKPSFPRPANLHAAAADAVRFVISSNRSRTRCRVAVIRATTATSQKQHRIKAGRRVSPSPTAANCCNKITTTTIAEPKMAVPHRSSPNMPFCAEI